MPPLSATRSKRAGLSFDSGTQEWGAVALHIHKGERQKAVVVTVRER